MISATTLEKLESDDNQMLYILGARLRRVKEIRDQVLSHPGRYSQVREEGHSKKDPSPLKVKQVECNGHRYIVCENPRQARKEAAERETILAALAEQVALKYKQLWQVERIFRDVKMLPSNRFKTMGGALLARRMLK